MGMKCAALLLFLVPTATALSYAWQANSDCQNTRSFPLCRPKCVYPDATNHTFSYPSNSDLPPATFIVLGVNSTLEFLDYIGCPGVSVKRLLLSDSIDEDIIANFGDYRQVTNYTDLYEIEMVRHHNRMLDIKWEHAYQDYRVLIRAILEHVAPTLVALSWVNYNTKSSPKEIDDYCGHFPDLDSWSDEYFSGPRDARQQHALLFPKEYPLLTELTVRTPDDRRHTRDIADAFVGFKVSDVVFPSLTHLHFASSIPYNTFDRLTVPPGRVFSEIAPNVTRIRLTGQRTLSESAPWTQVERKIWDRYPGAWERMMRVFRGTPTLTIRPPELLPNLTVIVQPGFPPSHDFDDGFGRSLEFWDYEERCYLPRYDRLLRTALSNPSVYVKLPEKVALESYGPSSGVYSLREAIEEFSNRSRGKEAGWSTPDSATEEQPERFWWWKDGKPPLKCPDGVEDTLVD